MEVGNQLPILLISFYFTHIGVRTSWESVTNPLDKLCSADYVVTAQLGISYQSS